jgi:hypothetical protein
MFNRSKQEPTLNYSANGFETQEVSRGGILHALFLKLTGQLTCTGANNTRANTLRGDAMALIRKLRVRVNSQENVLELDGPGLIADCEFLSGAKPRDLTGTLGDGATANPSFTVVIPLLFSVPRRKFRLPIDTALDCRASVMSKLEIEIDWKDHLAINASATGFTTAPRIIVESQKSFDADPKMSPGYLRRFLQAQTLSATNPKEIVRLATTQSYYGALINTTDAGADSSAILNRIKLVSGSNIFEDHDPVILNDGYGRIWQGHRSRAFSGAAFGYLDPMISTKWSDRAWYPVEIPFDGNLGELQPAQGLNELVFELDATVGGGTTVISTYPYQFVMPAVRGG